MCSKSICVCLYSFFIQYHKTTIFQLFLSASKNTKQFLCFQVNNLYHEEVGWVIRTFGIFYNNTESWDTTVELYIRIGYICRS